MKEIRKDLRKPERRLREMTERSLDVILSSKLDGYPNICFAAR